MTDPSIPEPARPRRLRAPLCRRAPAVVALAILATAAQGLPAAVAAPQPAAGTEVRRPVASQAGTKAAPRTVTLITGDRITVTGDQQPTVTPGPGREGMSFEMRNVNGRRSVLPSDAEVLVRSGRVDPRLFDVTTLLEQGLDRQDSLPLIVGATTAAATATARAAVTASGASAGRELTAVKGLAVRTERSKSARLWDALTGRTAAAEESPTTTRAGVRRIWLDGVLKVKLDRSVPRIGAPTAWRAGYDGTGVTVAVLDSGIDSTHPDFAGKVATVKDFVGGGPGDAIGHGTHVASIIAGSGAASNGVQRGVAPGVTLADGKVCDEDGNCPESGTIAGMHWAAAELRAPVVNMSLGGPDVPGVDAQEEALNTLSATYGTLFVVAAGNSGGELGDPYTVGSPGTADAALTVGAVDDEDRMADFSSRGPRQGDRAIKPDIVAPGVDIKAARAWNTRYDDGESGPYLTISGTSMAAPHTAGAAAILLQRRPGTAGEQLKRLLMASAVALPGTGSYDQGSGRVDVARAIGQTVTSLGNVELGRQAWPHDDDQPLTGTIGFRNGGTAAVTLDLTPSVTAPDGSAGPASALTLAESSVTVPAGGTATVGVTWVLPADAPVGLWSGRVVATAPGVQVQTALAMTQAGESYPVTITQLDRDGKRPADENGYVVLYKYDETVYGTLSPSTPSIDLPPGDYYMWASQEVETAQGEHRVFMVARQVTVRAATSVTFDARAAREIDVRIPQPGATPTDLTVMTEVRAPEGLWLQVIAGTGAGSRLWTGNARADGDTAEPRSDTSFTAAVLGDWARPDASGDFAASPYAYHGAWYRTGAMFDGLRRTLTEDKVATVVHTFGRNEQDHGVLDVQPNLPGVWEGGSTYRQNKVRLPHRRVDRFASDGLPVEWDATFTELIPTDTSPEAGVVHRSAVPAVYRAGRTYRDSWNVPVHGPVTVARSTYPEQAFDGDRLVVQPTLVGDRAGHIGYQATFDSARTLVTRNGTVVLDEPERNASVTVPREAADYRIQTRLDRTSVAALSTVVDAAWTFRSEPIVSDGRVDLPLSVIRFRPEVDPTGRLTSRGLVRIPVTVTGQGAAGETSVVTVRASSDDGRTWSKPQRVRLTDGKGTAVFPPSVAGRGFVSLRASAEDSRGATVDQTVIRAFRR